MRKFTAHDKRIVSHVLIVLSVVAENSSSIDLSWAVTGATNLHLVHYEVYRNGSLVGTTSNTTYSDTGLTMYTDYDYQVMGHFFPDVHVLSNEVTGTTTGTPFIYALVNSGANTAITTLDISTPETPSIVGTTSLGIANTLSVYNISNDDRYIYASIGHSGLNRRYVVDCNVPATPVVIVTSTAGLNTVVRRNLSTVNNVLFCCDVTGTKMQSWDITDPTTPVKLSEITPPDSQAVAWCYGYSSVRSRIYCLYSASSVNNYGYFDVDSTGHLTWGGFMTITASLSSAAGGAIQGDKWWYNDMTQNLFRGYPLEPQSGTPSKTFTAYPDNSFHVNGIVNPIVFRNRYHIHATRYSQVLATPIEIVDLNDSANPITTRRHIGDFGATCNWFTLVGNFLYWLRGSDSHLVVSDISDLDNITEVGDVTLTGVSPMAITSYDLDMWTGNNGLCAS